MYFCTARGGCSGVCGVMDGMEDGGTVIGPRG